MDVQDSLVEIVNNQALTTSLKVAEVFGKPHNDVMKSIRKLIDEIGGLGEISQSSMFAETTYKNQQNKVQPMYYMNRDGFTLLAMGFTGKKALKFKLDYIAAFNKMERLLNQSNGQPQFVNYFPPELSARWAEVKGADVLVRAAKTTSSYSFREKLIRKAAVMVTGKDLYEEDNPNYVDEDDDFMQ